MKQERAKKKNGPCHEHYGSVRFCCQIMSLFFFFSIYYSYFFFFSLLSLCLIRSLMVKCLLKQVVTWSSLPSPILSSLSKPYNCVCSHTHIFMHIRGLLLFQQHHTRVQIKQYICVRIVNWPLDHICIHGVCLSVCSYRQRRCTKTLVRNIENRQR